MPSTPIHLAVLVSGSGTTLQNLIDQIAAGNLNAKIAIVIASRPGIRGLQRAIDAGIPHLLIDRKQFPSVEDFSRRVFAACDAARVDLVCLGGWLSLLHVPPKYEGRVMNIHPALLPAFGGKGMYGHHVHVAVLKQGGQTSGCTVHFVDAFYDSGPIILQRSCPVLPEDTPDSLAHRVSQEEKIAYPEAIRLFAAGRLKIENRRVVISPT